MKRSPVILFFFFLQSVFIFAQEKPKLVIGLVVDQMTPDYLSRFGEKFGEGGFRLLLGQGYYFPNTYYGYAHTSTGPGHATIYTGTNPAGHGITENEWYVEEKHQWIYCAEDHSVNGINTNSDLGKRSPENLIGSTITDMLSLSSLGDSKVMGLALKDRSAILPAGHSADLALWWDDESGLWISSSYYTATMPVWMEKFDKNYPARSYLKTWESVSGTETNIQYKNHDVFESELSKGTGTSMPYDLKKISAEKGLSVLKYSPFGNTYTFDLAKMLLSEEKFGLGVSTDFLAISFSSTDYIGHAFGPFSEEVEDTYIRFDRDLADFLKFLDDSFGRENYLLFLTSDHGVVPNIEYLIQSGQQAAYYNNKALQEELEFFLLHKYNVDSLTRLIVDDQVYLDTERIKKNKLKLNDVSREVADFLLKKTDITTALTSHDLTLKDYDNFPKRELQQSYFEGRSGDVLFVRKPFMRSDENKKGSGHGTVYDYDRNVPLFWFGKNIRQGISYRNTDVTQISATLADLMQTGRPPTCTSESLADEICK